MRGGVIVMRVVHFSFLVGMDWFAVTVCGSGKCVDEFLHIGICESLFVYFVRTSDSTVVSVLLSLAFCIGRVVASGVGVARGNDRIDIVSL